MNTIATDGTMENRALTLTPAEKPMSLEKMLILLSALMAWEREKLKDEQ